METIKKTIKKIDNASNIFNFNDGINGFSITNGTLVWQGSSVRVTSSTADPYMYRNVTPFSGDAYRFVHIKYKIVSGTTTTAQIFYGISGGHSYDGNFYKNFSIISDNEWHIAVIDMSTLTGSGASDDWTTHMINRFRYDPATAHPTIVDIDYIAITNSFNPISSFTITGATYSVKLLLTKDVEDIGFFSVYENTDEYIYIQLSGTTTGITKQNINKFKSVLSGGTTLAGSGLGTGLSDGIVTGTTIHYVPYTVTGESSSRLSELRKYTTSTIFTNQYTGGGSVSIDGVDYPNSIANVRITYYLGGIKYVDDIVNDVTTFSFVGLGLLNPNFVNKPIYKDPQKENIISNPKINDDVFIIRQELSAFEKNYRLEYVKNLIELQTYAGGNFFNIVNNT